MTAGTGLLFGDSAELAAQLRQVLAAPDSPEFAALKSAARKRVEDHYSWDAVTTLYERLWQTAGR